MDIQGPRSAKILAKILEDPDKVFEGMAYFTFQGAFMDWGGEPVRLKNGLPILLSRTGYTGEFGFELFADAAHLVAIWTEVLEAGRAMGITPCGLAARDSLRAGAVLPLSHQDIGHWPFLRNPWTFALPYTEDQTGFTKEFIGDAALLSVRDADYTYPFIGQDLRKVTTSGETEVRDSQGKVIGTVLTCVSDMGIGRVGEQLYSIASPDKPEGFTPRGLSCGFIKVHPQLAAGTPLELRDGRRAITVTVTHDIRPDRTARVSIRKML
jgi:aminomethyltransferase